MKPLALATKLNRCPVLGDDVGFYMVVFGKLNQLTEYIEAAQASDVELWGRSIGPSGAKSADSADPWWIFGSSSTQHGV